MGGWSAEIGIKGNNKVIHLKEVEYYARPTVSQHCPEY